MEKFLQGFIEMLDTEAEVTMDSYVADIEEWDSLSIVSFVAMADINYGKKLVASDIRKVQTVSDLFNLVAGE